MPEPFWSSLMTDGAVKCPTTRSHIISQQIIQWSPKYTYIISRIFPITSRILMTVSIKLCLWRHLKHDHIQRIFVAKNWNICGCENVKNRPTSTDDYKLFFFIVEYILKTSVTNKVLYPKHHGSPCIWRQGFSWRRFLNFDPICLSFWVITKTRRLVVWFHSPYYALILGCGSVGLLLSIQARTCNAAMPGLHSLKVVRHRK